MPEQNYTISERLTAVEKTTKNTNDIVCKLEAAIYGNGKPGLITQLALLRQSVDEHHKEAADRIKSQKADWKWLVATLVAIGSVLTSMGAIFIK